MAKQILQDIKKIPKKRVEPQEVEKEQLVTLSIVKDKNNTDSFGFKAKKTQIKEQEEVDEIENDMQVMDKKDLREIHHFDEKMKSSTSSGKQKVMYDHLLRPINVDELKQKANITRLAPRDAEGSREKTTILRDKVSITTSESKPKRRFFGFLSKNKNNERNTKPSNYSIQREKTSHFPWVITTLSLLVLFFSVSLILKRAIVDITPAKVDIPVSVSLPLKKESSADSYNLKIIEMAGTETVEVEGTSFGDIESKAEGQVKLFNNFSNTSQYLLTDTRLESANGKIYKIKGETVIPGYTINNKEKVPGQVTVTVVAENSGTDYNQSATDFKIFGFKGTPKGNLFYGRSQGELKGGYKGKGTTISPEQKQTNTALLKENLQKKLITQAKANIPEGVYMFDTATRFVFDEVVEDFKTKEKKDILTLSGKIIGILVNEKDVEKAIVASPNFSNEKKLDLSLQDLSALVVSVENPKDFTTDTTEATLKITGSAKFKALVRETSIAYSLKGKSVKDFKSIILADHPEVGSADLTLRPFWQRYFPNQSKDIKVKINRN